MSIFSKQHETTNYFPAYVAADIAAIFGYSVAHVRTLIREGRVQSYRSGKARLVVTASMLRYVSEQNTRGGK